MKKQFSEECDGSLDLLAIVLNLWTLLLNNLA